MATMPNNYRIDQLRAEVESGLNLALAVEKVNPTACEDLLNRVANQEKLLNQLLKVNRRST